MCMETRTSINMNRVPKNSCLIQIKKVYKDLIFRNLASEEITMNKTVKTTNKFLSPQFLPCKLLVSQETLMFGATKENRKENIDVTDQLLCPPRI